MDLGGVLLGVFQSGGGDSTGCFREARRPWLRTLTLLERQVSISNVSCYRITVERARGTPRGSDQWRYGDSRGGYGDSRRSA